MNLKLWVKNLWNSFPVQLVLLHFKKHQLILIYWSVLFATILGKFMFNFGAKYLFLAPEYLGSVSFFSTLIVGVAVGVFIMSWNITTFILFSRHFKFLATAEKPFLIYCLNNFIIPLIFIVIFCIGIRKNGIHNELLSGGLVFLLITGFLLGIFLLIFFSFIYFFRADKTIQKYTNPVLVQNAYITKDDYDKSTFTSESNLIKVKTYLAGFRKAKLVREVKHYNKDFIENVFSKHHLAGIFLIFVAILVIFINSFFLDNAYFQLPAAASITVFFAILLALFGALAYFLQNWSLPFTIGCLFILNFLFKHHIIDPTNKAYGLNYKNNSTWPIYDANHLQALCTANNVTNDSLHTIQILNNWKAHQTNTSPTLYFLNVSGGGSRSATFTMHILQQLDSIMNKQLMQKTFMINGASGGMLGAAFYRQLHLQQIQNKINNKNNTKYVEQIGDDLLNPIFSSLVARDLLNPLQKFEWQGNYYIKDRAYAFEQKLNKQTNDILQIPLYALANYELEATIPMMIFSSVITRDSRKLLISTQPISYLMQPISNTAMPDAIDFTAFFKNQQATHLNLLTALRMNATFPYVLPSVWLPSNPVIDVMDAGIRDNFGQDITLRFITKFKDWIKQNTSTIKIISIRDRPTSNWDIPFEDNSLIGLFIKPITQSQYNIFKTQDYLQNEQLSLVKQMFAIPIEKISFVYEPSNKISTASLSFHLTQNEKKSIQNSIWTDFNKNSFAKVR